MRHTTKTGFNAGDIITRLVLGAAGVGLAVWGAVVTVQLFQDAAARFAQALSVG